MCFCEINRDRNMAESGFIVATGLADASVASPLTALFRQPGRSRVSSSLTGRLVFCTLKYQNVEGFNTKQPLNSKGSEELLLLEAH